MRNSAINLDEHIHLSAIKAEGAIYPSKSTQKYGSRAKAKLRAAKLGTTDSIETRQRKSRSYTTVRWRRDAWQAYFDQHGLACTDDYDINRRTYYLYHIGENFDSSGFSLEELKQIYLEKKRRNGKKYYERNREIIAGRPKPTICEACGETRTKIVFDHCHNQGHFRGWLCDRCNRTLGLLEDKIEIAKMLIVYLEKDAALSPDQKLARKVNLKLAGYEGKKPKTFIR